VSAGDTVAVDQLVLELETDKATIEVPSGVAGTVGEVLVKERDRIKVGQVVLTLSDGDERQQGTVDGPEVQRAPEPVEKAVPKKRGDVVEISRGARPQPSQAEAAPQGPAHPAAPSRSRKCCTSSGLGQARGA
jgi:pyruvate/2-oxoglutarate dehydrogenase complex dihydrolipoamide acyltransferase (E2) component